MIKSRTIPQAVFDSKEARRIQAEGHRQACSELDRTPNHLLCEGNPNHPMHQNKIFGYDQTEFLKKQYRELP